MANVVFGAPVYSDVGVLYTPTLSGGSWAAGLPLTNLQDRRLHYVARSSTDAVADTLFTVDLGVNRAVRVLAIPTHNLSSVGTVRARGFTDTPILDALDFSTGWTATGTPTRVAASYDGSTSDGVPLDLIGDDDAAVLERYSRTVVFTGDATKIVAFRAKQGSSTTSAVELWDGTALVVRMRMTITWTAGVPNTPTGTGTHLSTTLIGDGVYRFVVLSNTVTAANTNTLYVEPSLATPSATGTTYMGDVLAWNLNVDGLAYDTGAELGIPSGLDAEEADGLNVAWYHVAATAQAARYWRFNINDTTNPDTYIDLGRLIIAGGFQPAINLDLGATLGLEDDSTSVITDGGAAIHHARRHRRTATGVLAEMSDADQLTWRQLQKTLGTTGQLFFVLDPDDTTLAHERAFLAVFSQLDAIEYPTYARARSAFALREEL